MSRLRELSNLNSNEEKLRILIKCANSARRSLMRKRITTGAVESIEVNLVAKCGGVVVGYKKMLLVVNIRSIKHKRKKKTSLKIKMKKIQIINRNATAVGSMAIRLNSAQMIQIIALVKKVKTRLNA